MGYDVHIVKTDDWLDAASNPITKEEVDKLVASDKELEWSELDYVEMIGPGGERVRYFAILWRNSPVFYWRRNEIKSSSPDEERIMKMVELAEALKANVIGDDHERYRIEKGFTGRKKLISE